MRYRRPGATIDFSTPAVEQEFRSEAVSFNLRAALWLVAMIYHEQGAERIVVKSILGPGIYASGNAADVSVLELPGVSRAFRSDRYALPAWIAWRISHLCPYGDGAIETAVYHGDRLTVRVPPQGFKSYARAGALWRELGPTGRRILKPGERKRIEEPER